MKKTVPLILAVLLVWSLAAFAGDSGSSAGVPKLITISKFEVKMGKGGEFNNLVRQVGHALNAGNANYHYIGATPMFGNTGYTEFIQFYDTFGQFQDAEKAFNTSAGALMKDTAFNRDSSDSIGGHKAMIAKLQEEISYNLDQLDIAHATAWDVSFIKLRPGYSKQFEDLEKESIAFHKQGNIDERWAVYRVKFGGSGSTYIFVRPLKSLADLDVDRTAAHKTVISDLTRQRFSQFAREAVESEESTVLQVHPELSRPPQTLVAANPDFWTVKETTTPTTAQTRKKSPVQPAAMKEGDQKQ